MRSPGRHAGNFPLHVGSSATGVLATGGDVVSHHRVTGTLSRWKVELDATFGTTTRAQGLSPPRSPIPWTESSMLPLLPSLQSLSSLFRKG
jgi:hypothetical protein